MRLGHAAPRGSGAVRALGLGIVAALAIAAPAPSAAAIAIPSVIPATPAYVGHPATAHHITGVPATPRNPHMAANGSSEIHNDAWQTDAYTYGGPLGRSPLTYSAALAPQRDCGSIAFDARGRLISVCVGVTGPQLYMFDPKTLDTLATFTLPPRQSLPTNLFQDFTGGGYFYLDNHDRVVTSTTTHHILVIAETAGGAGFQLVRDYDLSHVLTSGENITSALPDSTGLLWFVTKTDGVVGTLNLATGALHTMHLGNGALGEIENSFATGMQGDVYIATNRKLYRFVAGRGGVPRIVWQTTYPNSFQHKPGQVDDGTGTTPTVMQGGYVNITDNADPMDIMVYRTAQHPSRIVGRGHHRRRQALPRQVCRVPVFGKGASDDENSIIVAGRAMIAENNYGYTDPGSITLGKLTAPGFVRVDIDANGLGCHKVWTNTSERAPTAVSKLSLATGLVYTYTKEPGASDPWYWTALDFRTGRTVYRVAAGTGALTFNNNYAGIAISRTGTEYLGTLSGPIALRDGS
jgi:hypothetical protein